MNNNTLFEDYINAHEALAKLCKAQYPSKAMIGVAYLELIRHEKAFIKSVGLQLDTIVLATTPKKKRNWGRVAWDSAAALAVGYFLGQILWVVLM